MLFLVPGVQFFYYSDHGIVTYFKVKCVSSEVYTGMDIRLRTVAK